MTRNSLLETLRSENEEDFEDEIWFEVFPCILKKMDALDSFILLFFTKKVNTVIFIERG